MLRLENKVALVTGGAQGIGMGIVRSLMQNGAKVAVVDTQEAAALDLANELSPDGKNALAVFADISNQKGCQDAVAKTVDYFGGLDCLVNNAAPGRNRAMIGELIEVDWQGHSDVILEAAVWLVESAEPFLKDSKKGTIVNISSVTARQIAPEQCSWAYHVSKAGLEQLTRYLANRLGPDNIRVNAIAPGLVNRLGGVRLSDNPDNQHVIEAVVPLQRAAEAHEIGSVVSFLCSEDASYMSGQILTVDGGMGTKEVFGAALRL